ncbi:MAG: hypothetical protein COB85_03865 [Bacteroidetes bacterium]|nr:MAG: hypothetical protein COB85_03865 [Bacteroidota bacterium]
MCRSLNFSCLLRETYTYSIEGFFSHSKSGLHGTYYHCSPKHLQRYCDKFTFRYNTRKIIGEERFDLALSQADGRRLKYAR